MRGEFEDLVKVYIRDINAALQTISDEDIMEVFKKLYEKEQLFSKKLQSTAPGRQSLYGFHPENFPFVKAASRLPSRISEPARFRTSIP